MEVAEHGMEMLKLCDKLHPGLPVERGTILLSMATMLQQILSQVQWIILLHANTRTKAEVIMKIDFRFY